MIEFAVEVQPGQAPVALGWAGGRSPGVYVAAVELRLTLFQERILSFSVVSWGLSVEQ